MPLTKSSASRSHNSIPKKMCAKASRTDSWKARKEGRAEDEGWRVHRDGRRFWANVIITALYDRTGKLRGFGKVTRDYSERKKTEEELHRKEEELHQAQERLRRSDGWRAGWRMILITSSLAFSALPKT